LIIQSVKDTTTEKIYDYEIEPEDIIKFGRLSFRVKYLVEGEKGEENLDKKKSIRANFTDEFENDVRTFVDETGKLH
jgi:hypothetical protein